MRHGGFQPILQRAVNTRSCGCYCNRYFWVIAAAYMLPFAVVIGCTVAATVIVAGRHNPAQIEEDDELPSRLKEQRRMLKFLAALVVSWVVGNVPLVYFLRGSASPAVEAVLVTAMVGHQAALPVAVFVWRRRVWSRMRRFVRGLKRRRPRTVGGTDRRRDAQTVPGGGGGGAGGPERPGGSPRALDAGTPESETYSNEDGDRIDDSALTNLDGGDRRSVTVSSSDVLIHCRHDDVDRRHHELWEDVDKQQPGDVGPSEICVGQ